VKSSSCQSLRDDVRRSLKGFLTQRFQDRTIRCPAVPGAGGNQRREPIPDARQCDQPLFHFLELFLGSALHFSDIALL
jgi:hypothetical protein